MEVIGRDEEVFKTMYQHNSGYMVSNYGKIRNKKTGRTLKPTIDKNGFHNYMIKIDGELRNIKGHLMVMYYFNTDIFSKIVFINGNKQDLYYKNLKSI